MTVLVVCGLAAEARIAAGPGVMAIAAPPDALPAALALVGAVSAVVSFGIAGGLAPGVGAGTLCIAGRVRGRGAFARRAVLEAVAARCMAGGIDAVAAEIVSTGRPVATPEGKRALHLETGAAAVDTESGIAAAWAEGRGVPFLALRAVADDADATLPPLALVAIGPDGRLAVGAILRELVARPGQLAALPGTARATRLALATLRRTRALLGPGLGLGAG